MVQPVAQSVRSKPVALLAIVAFLAAPLAAQAVKKCYDCKGTGLIACAAKECKQEKVCGIKIPHKCDAIYAAECCRGTQKVLCPKCKDPIVETELQSELESRKAWVDAMRKVDKGAQTRFAHVETDHWIFHCSLPAWKVGETTYTRVKGAHLWADRLEENSVFVQKYLGQYPAQKQTGNLVATADEAMRTTLTVQGIGHTMPYKTYSLTGAFTTRPHEEFITDELLHPHFVHTATHVQLHATYAAPLNFCPWFHEAFAHWVEIERFKTQRTFCYQEVSNAKDPWRLADWKKQIFGEVSARRDEPLAAIMTRDTDKLSARDKAHAWSFLEFLIKTRPKDFRKFFETLKDTEKDTKKAMQTAYGWSTAAFQEKWREYVIKTYAP